MSRAWILSFGCVLVASLANAQLIKPLDRNKMSDYGHKQFQTKSWAGQEYPTKLYGKPGGYETKPFPIREFSHSSKSFEIKSTDYSSKKVAAPAVETKSYSGNSKEFS